MHRVATHGTRPLTFQHASQALHLASCNGHTAVVNLLLDSGADASAVDHFGKTPLQEAVGAEAFATADVLLARGGKLLLVDESSVLCTLAFKKVGTHAHYFNYVPLASTHPHLPQPCLARS